MTPIAWEKWLYPRRRRPQTSGSAAPQHKSQRGAGSAKKSRPERRGDGVGSESASELENRASTVQRGVLLLRA